MSPSNQHSSKEHLNLLSPITLLFLAYVHSSPAAAPTAAADLLLSESPMASALQDQAWVAVFVLGDLSAICDMVDFDPLEAPTSHVFLDVIVSWFLKIYFSYFWQGWVFVALRGPSLVVASRLQCPAPHCSGFSRCGALAPGAWASVVQHRFSAVAAHGL